MGTPRIKKRDAQADRSKKKLAAQKKLTAAEVNRALLEASAAIDRQGAEIAALKRIIVSERAQLIYFMELTVKYAKREILDISPVSFHDLAEEVREEYVKRAIKELEQDEGPAPREQEKPKGKIEIVN